MAAQHLLILTSPFKPISFSYFNSLFLVLSPSLFLGLAYASFSPLWSSQLWGQGGWDHVEDKAIKAKDGWIFLEQETCVRQKTVAVLARVLLLNVCFSRFSQLVCGVGAERKSPEIL